MDVVSHMREVLIEVPLDEVVGFLRKVPNLPRWTGFFLKAGPKEDDLFSMETVIGPSKTRMEEQSGEGSHRLEIVSYFGSRRETATVCIARQPSGSLVQFHLRLPSGLPQARTDRQLAQLEAELLSLKRMLEARALMSHAAPESVT